MMYCACAGKNLWPKWAGSAIGAILDAGGRSLGTSEGVNNRGLGEMH